MSKQPPDRPGGPPEGWGPTARGQQGSEPGQGWVQQSSPPPPQQQSAGGPQPPSPPRPPAAGGLAWYQRWWWALAIAALVVGAGIGGASQPEPEGRTEPVSSATTATKPSTPERTQPPAPAFPQGIWTSGSPTGLTAADLAQIKRLGYDFVQANPDLTVLDRVYAAGLKALIWLGNYRNDKDLAPNCTWNTPDATLKQQIRRVKNHPATFAYFVADEPHVGACTRSPKQIRDRHNLIRSMDPNIDHKTVITENQTEDYWALANTTDVMGLVGYPCSIAKGCRQSVVQARIDWANIAGVRHYWSMPQVDGDSYYRVPTPSELKQIYAWWRAPWSRQEGALTFLWHGCSSCDGLANHRELHATVLAEIRTSKLSPSSSTR
jgi:hypothetical protein